MRAIDAVRSGFTRYVEFFGRSSRSEFWWFWLFAFLAWLTAGLVDSVIWKTTGAPAFFPITVDDFSTPTEQIRFYALNDGTLARLTQLALFIPVLAVAVRRLHDDDRSGRWILLSVVPLIGWLFLLCWYCRRGKAGPIQFSPDPRAIVAGIMS